MSRAEGEPRTPDGARYDLPASHLTNVRGSSQARIISWVPAGSRVLDLGCAAGIVARALTESKGCAVIGVEADAGLAEKARPFCREVLVTDLEDPRALDRAAALGPFDAVILADILEHLRDPRATLDAVHPLLADGGRLLVSLPNIANWRVRLALLFGRFEYTETGILDRTHLRFYTRRSAALLLTDAGFRIEEEASTAGSGRPLPALLARLFPGLFAYQILFRAARTER